MKRWISLLILAGSLAACAIPTEITPVATGGSKADGIVELGFEHAENQRPVIDEMKALETASKRCRAWGYSRAEKFGGHKRQCLVGGGFTGCAQRFIPCNINA